MTTGFVRTVNLFAIMRTFLCVLVFVLMPGACEQFNYKGMLDNILSAAQSRARTIRETGGAPETMKDSFSVFIDYASERLKNPPFDAIEVDLILLQLEIAKLRHSLHKLQATLNLVGIETTPVALECTHKLVPVQPSHRSRITNQSQTC